MAFGCHVPQLLQGQNTALDWNAFRGLVLSKHPEARQADLLRDQASAALFRAKGGFDLKSYADFNAKNFKDKNYFRHFDGGLKLPTWGGLELKGSYTWADGVFLNPETSLPSVGQAAFGFNWTLGQGLMIDERRADLKAANAGLGQAEAERAAGLNNLLFEAAKYYYEWVLAQNQLAVVQNALVQARIRHEGIREGFIQGERAAIDSLESFIQLQNRQLDVNFAQTDLQNAAIALSNFLWPDAERVVLPESLGNAPMLSEGTFPPPLPESLQDMLQTAVPKHPDLRYYRAKLQVLEVERRLKQEKRKPILDLSYSLLGNGFAFFPAVSDRGPAVLVNDIKWGLSAAYPIPNRKARGDLQITQIKIAQTDLELRQKRQSIENKTRQYANELVLLSQQITLYRDIVTNYRALLDAETEKFNLGESSIFLINTREQRWLEAQIKYLKLIKEYRKAEAGMQWAAGVL